jgi:hypothetical protein
LEVLFLRDDDIPQTVATGVADLGIVGENEFMEKAEDAEIVKRLGSSLPPTLIFGLMGLIRPMVGFRVMAFSASLSLLIRKVPYVRVRWLYTYRFRRRYGPSSALYQYPGD